MRAIVLGKSVQIGPRKYVPVDAYQAIANAMGCVASARDVRKVDGGLTAIGEVRRLSDGAILAEGEGFVGDDEPKWKNGPEYARRSMAQTRAIGRACRAAFAFVVPMIDLGLSSTPAEEMEGLDKHATETAPAPAGVAGVKARMNPNPTPPSRASSIVAGHDRSLEYPFGNCKGLPISDPRVDDKSITFWLTKAQGELSDPSKAKWHDRAAKTVATLQAEQAYRAAVAREQSAPPEPRGGQHSAPAPYGSDGADEPPPYDDNDAPPF